MDKIRLKKDAEPIDLTESLLMAAYCDAREEINNGAVKSLITLGLVNIAEEERFITITISNELEGYKSYMKEHLMYIKNRIKCEANMADKQKVLDIINQYIDEQK